jgi:hypothetical protein
MPRHGCFINDDALVLSTTGNGAWIVKRPVIDSRPGYKLNARRWALYGSPDNRSIDTLMIRVCLF